MYYKQVKGYTHSLPTYFKAAAVNSQNEKSKSTNNLPIIEKYCNNDTNSTKISFSNITSFNSSYLMTQSGLFQQQQQQQQINKLISQSTNNLNQTSSSSTATGTNKLDQIADISQSSLASSLSTNNNVKRIKNIDFKIDSSMRRLLESNQSISSQKLMPSSRINKYKYSYKGMCINA